MDFMFRISLFDFLVFFCIFIKFGKNVEIYLYVMVGFLYEKLYFV